MAYFKPEGLRENIEKESWYRSEQVMNILGMGEALTIHGQIEQNPFYVCKGNEIMLEVVAPLFKEKEDVEVLVQGKDGLPELKKKVKENVGRETIKYRDYLKRIKLATDLMNAAISNKYENRTEIQNSAYRILMSLKIDILQDINDYGLNFKAKPNKFEAYKEKEF